MNPQLTNTALNLLTGSETHFEFPSLQKKAVASIASNISKVIYGTLRPKNEKRGKLLKFIHGLCQQAESHDIGDNCDLLLNSLNNKFGINPIDPHEQIIEFNHLKLKQQQKKHAKLTYVYDRDVKDVNDNLQVNLIKSAPHGGAGELPANVFPKATHLLDNQQTKRQFCYALANLNKHDLLLDYLDENHCVEFIVDYDVDLALKILEKFSFVLDKLILELCTELVCVKHADNVEEFFKKDRVLRVKVILSKNGWLNKKIKSFMYQLYVYSYCNVNIMRFCTFVTEN